MQNIWIGYHIAETTYKECNTYCKKMASYLKEKINEPKGFFIGIKMKNSIEWIATFWGLLMIGYKPVLLNNQLSDDFNQYICTKLNVRTIIEDIDEHDSLDVNKLIISLNEADKYDEIKSVTWENEIALSTTATSKNIKICIYNGFNFTNQVLNTKKILRKNKMIKKHYNQRLKILAFLPFYHVFGLIAVYFWFSIFGRTFVFLKDYSPDTILKTVRKHKVTHIFAVPLLWHKIYYEIDRKVNRT